MKLPRYKDLKEYLLDCKTGHVGSQKLCLDEESPKLPKKVGVEGVGNFSIFRRNFFPTKTILT